MNKTFDIKRFGNIVRYDAMSYFKNFGWTLIVLLALPIGIWFLFYTNMSTFHSPYMHGGRYAILKFIMILAVILAPSRLYKTCNDPRRGIQFAMLPASTLEKFLSMIFFCCVATPIIYMTGAVAIDTILTLIPGNNPYDGFVFNQIFNYDIVTIDPNMNSDAAEYYDEITKLPLYKFFAFLAYVSIFIFTNMLFKKRKVSKTIGILVVVGIIAMVAVIRFSMNYEGFDNSFTEEEFHEYNMALIRWIYYGGYVVNVIISTVLLYLTYYKIRKQKY